MNKKEIKNFAVSVRAKLKNKATIEKRPFQEVLQYYAMERFLYRVSLSPHSHKFILKGALMLLVWGSPEIRSTMDIDFLGKTSNEVEKIISQITDILKQKNDLVANDGIQFDIESLQAERIKKEADYQGVRVKFKGLLDSAKINMQIDIGFGDVIFPQPEKLTFPVILEASPTPVLLCYSRESVIAEKFEAMVKLGELNSRMKDFYDIWLLARQFTFESSTLLHAIQITFQNRGTEIPEKIRAFSPEFAEQKQTQWNSFRKRLNLENIVPMDFKLVVNFIAAFISPLLASNPKNNPMIWNPKEKQTWSG